MNHLERIAQEAADRGVKDVFGIPGSGPSLSLIHALEQQGVAFHLTHFEGAAVIMAGALGRIRRETTMAIGIKGPGLSNMVPGMAACHLERLPVITATEAYPPGAPANKAHKRLDHGNLVAAVCKGRYHLGEIAPTFHELASLAEGEAPGPVHLEISGAPMEQAPELPESNLQEFIPMALGQALELASKAERPVIIAGTLAIRKNWGPLLEKLAIPVFSTAAAKGVLDERLPQSGGVYTGAGGPLAPEKAILPEADLVIGLGLRHNEVLAATPFHCPAIAVDPMGEAESDGFAFSAVIRGGAEEMESLAQALSGKEWGLETLAITTKKLRSHLLEQGFMPASIMAAIEEHFDHQARVVMDTGNFCVVAEHVWRAPTPELHIASGQGRYMGVGLPMAIGASIADATVPTVLFTGDGGLGMFVAEARIAVKLGLPLAVVLLTDGHLGTILGGALAKDLTQKPTQIAAPSWLDAMAGCGYHVKSVDSLASLGKALAAWNCKSPLFLEAAFDPMAYQKMTVGVR